MNKFIFCLLILLLPTAFLYGQCSDAGVCSFHSNDEGIFRRSGIGAQYLNGYSGKEDDIIYETAKLSGYYWFSRELNLGVVIPASRQRGKLGTVQGLGDVIVVLDYLVNDHPGDLTLAGETSLIKGTFEKTSIQIGSKFASGAVNTKGLPLRYQSGLGTNDLLLGAIYTAAHARKYDYDLFEGGLTLQIPFGTAGNSIDSLERGIDLLGRIGYQYPILQSFGIKGEMLAIKRLTKSTLHNSIILTEDGSPDPVGIIGSYQVDDNTLQINLTASATYNIQQDIFFETGFAIALLHKKLNYDGLNRSYTLFASANYHFRLLLH
ncbi:MAG: hypothetical protein ABI778_08575 [Ignavibacteriota bacterium]